MFNILVVSDYDSRVKWGMSLARRLCTPETIDVVLLPHQVDKVARYINGTRNKFVRNNPIEFLNHARLDVYDIVVVALGGGANVKAAAIVKQRFVEGQRRPLLVGGFNGLTDRNDPDAILCRVGLDLVTVNCQDDLQSFERILSEVGADAPSLLVSGYLRDYRSCTNTAKQGRHILFVQQDGVPKSAKAYRYLITGLCQFVQANPEATLAIKLRDENRIGINRQNSTYDARQLTDSIIKRAGENARIFLDFRDVEEIMEDCNEVWSISSTVLLEALALGKRSASISDFGISRYLGNAPFVGSGLFIGLERLRQGAHVEVDETWKRRNAPPSMPQDQLVRAIKLEMAKLAQNSFLMRRPYYEPSPWLAQTNRGPSFFSMVGDWVRKLGASSYKEAGFYKKGE